MLWQSPGTPNVHLRRAWILLGNSTLGMGFRGVAPLQYALPPGTSISTGRCPLAVRLRSACGPLAVRYGVTFYHTPAGTLGSTGKENGPLAVRVLSGTE